MHVKTLTVVILISLALIFQNGGRTAQAQSPATIAPDADKESVRHFAIHPEAASSIPSGTYRKPEVGVQLSADTVPPTVTITAPAANSFIDAHKVSVTGTASDDSSGIASVLVNGSPAAYNLATNKFSALIQTEAEGPFTISITATDNAGNTSIPVTQAITIDRTAPSITIDSPTEGSTTDSTITVTGTVTDLGSGPAKVTVNQALATLNGTAYSVTLRNFCDQPLVITAVAFDKANNVAVAKRSVTVVATSPSPCWSRIGPEGGDTIAVATHPTDSKIVYAGSSNGQVFKSVDAGANWVSASVGLPGLPINSLLITQTNPLTIYAGVSRQVYKSSDGGNSWQPSSLGLSNSGVIALNGDPANPDVVYASTFNTLFKSENAGGNWFPLNDVITGRPNSVTVDPADSNVVYAVTSDGVFKSLNGGLSWQPKNSGLPTSFNAINNLVIDPTNTNVIYASSPNGAFKSTNGGGSWIGASNGLPIDAFTFFRFILRMDPESTTTLYAATSKGFFKSTDSAGSWSTMNSNLPQARQFFDFAFGAAVPHAFYLATNAGIYKSANSGQSWDFTNHGLTGSVVRLLTVDPTGSKIIYAVTDGAGLKTEDGGQNWQVLPTADLNSGTESLGIDPFNRHTLYAGVNFFQIFKSTDDGATWNDVLDKEASVLTLDPSKPDTIYAAGSSGVFKSANGGQNWSALSRGFFGFSSVASIILDPRDTNIVYIADFMGVTKSVNGGSTWTILNNGLVFQSVTSLITDIADPRILYAASNNIIFKSTDSGSNWTQLSSELSSQFSISSLVQDPDNPSIMYAATSTDVFKSTDGGAHWDTIMNGLPFSFFSQPIIDPDNLTTLYIGSDTGVFVLQQPADPNELIPAISGLSPTVATLAGPAFNLTITGTSFVAGSKVLWNGSPRLTTFNSGTQLTATITAADIANKGVATVTVINPGNHTSNSQTVKIGKTDQTITFGPLPNKIFNGTSFTIDATATSGLPVSFSVVSGPASVSGNTVTMLAAGTVVLEAHQDGNAEFNAAQPVDQSFVINNPLAQILKLSPGAIIAGSGQTTVKILGGFYVTDTLVKVDGIDHAATYVNPIEMDMVLSPAEIATPGTKTIRVFNSAPGGGTSIAVTLKIISITSSDSKNIQPGTTDTVSNAPTQSGEAGITAQLNHSQSAGGPAIVTVEQYSGDPLGGSGLIDVGGGYVDLKVTGSAPGDILNATFYYGSNVTGANEDKLQLLYFTGTKWAKVRSSGNTDPIKNTTDNQDGTVSGGSFTVVFDETSSPKLSQLTGTIFSSTPGLYGDLNNDQVVNVVDLILMANFLAGNTTVDKTAGDLTQDGKLNVSDLIMLANFLAGNVAHLPVTAGP